MQHQRPPTMIYPRPAHDPTVTHSRPTRNQPLTPPAFPAALESLTESSQETQTRTELHCIALHCIVVVHCDVFFAALPSVFFRCAVVGEHGFVSSYFARLCLPGLSLLSACGPAYLTRLFVSNTASAAVVDGDDWLYLLFPWNV